MNLRVHDHAPVDLGGRTLRDLRDQRRAGGDCAAQEPTS